MTFSAREMRLDEVDVIIDYFHGSSPEHLDTLGVDPTRLPPPGRWRELYAAEYRKSAAERAALLVMWEMDGTPVGFSTADKIVYGESAHMHLHVVEPGLRQSGVGSACLPQTVDLYFAELGLRRLYCEPNAFNLAPNRALQRAGFTYVKTYLTVPGPLNFRQPVTRWVYEKQGPC